MVGDSGFEPETPVLSVLGHYKSPLIKLFNLPSSQPLVEILRHLVAIGELSQQVLMSLDDNELEGGSLPCTFKNGKESNG